MFLVALAMTVCAAARGQSAPFAHTHAAGPVAADGATLNGVIVPNSLPTTAWFEWGATTNYGQVVTLTNLYNGTALIRISAQAPAWPTNSAYHFRLGCSNAAGVVYGIDRAFRVAAGGRLAAWGHNVSGEASVPAGLSNIVALVAGPSQSFALLADGTVLRWGDISPGTENFTVGLSNVIALSASAVHILVLKGDGTVAAFGRLSGTNVPPGLSNVVAIAAGGTDGTYFSLATKADGTVAAWGSNGRGQTSVPNSLTNVVAVAAGGYHSVALKADGNVVSWGSSSTQTNVPAGLNNVVGISCGVFHTLALRADGKVFAWGSYYYPVNSLANIVAIAAGNQHEVALRADGSIAAVGYINQYGDAAAPAGLSNAVLIAAGGSHIIALGHNAAPSVSSIVTWTYVNADHSTQLPAPFDANNDPIQLYIKYPPASGQLFQYESGLRGAPIVTSGTPVADPLRRVIYAPPPDSFDTVYGAFGYAASDGEVESRTASVTMQIFAPDAPQLSAAKSGFATNGDFELHFSGSFGAAYKVWASTNLTHWEALGPATATSNFYYRIKDPNAPNFPRRFYRAGAP